MIYRIPIQYACRVGACGLCRVQVVSGEYRSLFVPDGILTPAELAAGYTLACKTYPLGDLEIRV